MESIAALRCDRVSFAYGAHVVLREVSLALRPGEGMALLGPNGAGKTTLTRLAIGLLHPASGEVVTAGLSTARRWPEDFAAHAGYLFQHPEAQLFERTVQADVAFGPRRLGWPGQDVAEAVRGTLDELGLLAEAQCHPYDLAMPRRRLVALAGVLVASPRILILDEPTAALDRAGRDTVIRVVRARLERGAAVLVVTHDMEFAAEVTERALVLSGGTIAYDGTLSAAIGTDPGYPLSMPPAVEVARRLGLATSSLRRRDLATSLAQRCRSLRGGLS